MADTDRFNTVESDLETDLNAESAITDEFGTIERGFREDYTTFYDHQLPSISFEAVSASPSSEAPEYNLRNIHVNIEIHCRYAKYETTRQKIKELISLVEDFLMSEQNTKAEETTVGQSGFITTKDSTGFRGIGGIEAIVEVHLPSTTIK